MKSTEIISREAGGGELGGGRGDEERGGYGRKRCWLVLGEVSGFFLLGGEERGEIAYQRVRVDRGSGERKGGVVMEIMESYESH